MKNAVSITNNKENTLDFDMKIEGAKTSDVKCKFVIRTKGMELAFNAKATDKDKTKWTVKLPKLDILERTAYDCFVQVVVDGYYFEPMKGVLNVTAPTEVYTTEPKTRSLTSGRADIAKEATKKKPVKEKQQVNVNTLAKQIMEGEKYDPKLINEKVEEKNNTSDKDKKVRAILEEAGLRTLKKERPSFIKTRLLNS